MTLPGKNKGTPSAQFLRRSAVITVACDIVLIVALVLCLFAFISSNRRATFNRNVENVTDISVVESGLMRSALNRASDEIKSAYNYCAGKDVEDILDYLSVIGDPQTDEYQLLKANEEESTDMYHVYTGYSTRRDETGYRAVSYSNSALATSIYNFASDEDGRPSFSQNFTNSTDALRYFAVFCGIEAREDGVTRRFYLVKPQKEETLLSQLQVYSQYDDLSLAVCYTDGKYLASDNGFRADNFYDYLYKYNDLTLDERNAIMDEVLDKSSRSGCLFYRDYQGRDCAFAYSLCSDTDNWQVIVSVPTDEFVSGQLLSFFPLTIIIFLAVLLLFNVWRLLSMVRQLRQSMAREVAANASKSSFLSRMSHEIRTPLNAIIGYNAMALTELETADGGSEVKDSLLKSDLASKHLLSIINDVLDMSAIESGKLKIANDRFDLKSLINSLTTIFFSQARAKEVDLDVKLGNLTDEWFMGDQMRVSQILTNLLSNAVKFTPEGGSVTVRIDQCDPASPGHIRFRIEDTGIGMEPEYLEHIWDPFEQADSSISRRFGGTGLGLSITKTLVDLMDGTIAVESVPGEGTVFTVEITFGITEQPKLAGDHDFDSVNALIVDDDPSACDYIKLLFDRCGAGCATVNSGADALAAAKAASDSGESFTMYIVDWQMPEMDGIETIERLRDIIGAETPIIVLTAYDYAEVAARAQALGVSRFITKPLFQSSLFDLLASASGLKDRASERKKGLHNDFGGARVLLAEDNRMNMEIALRILGSANLVVDGAWNGREAVEMFTASDPDDYAAILMDVHMPEMNGYDATRAIRASSHPRADTVPIIAMTADVFAEDIAEAKASGMNDHVGKPIDIPVLFATLAKYIKK